MITESGTAIPPAAAWINAALSIGPSLRTTIHAMTATWPANIAAKMNRPHRVVPQNFQIRGGRGGKGGGTATGGVSGLRESIRAPFSSCVPHAAKPSASCRHDARASTSFALGNQDVDGRVICAKTRFALLPGQTVSW